MKASLQSVFCSRESTNCLMIQQNEKSTQNYIRPIWDGSTASTKGLGKTSDKGLWLQESHLDVSTRELFQSVLD